MSHVPQRIVCLSAETADWFWRLGAWENVAGVTAFFSQPPDAPPKPRVSGFNSANWNEIEKLNPDLVITFSDVQSQLAAELIRRGFSVLATNQRTLSEIENTLALLSKIVGRECECEKLLNEFRKRLAPVETKKRPRVYFEEWNEPFISGIAWVSELIERAGGEDIFSQLKSKRAAMERVVSSEQVCAADPEIIFASWCGKPVDAAIILARENWQNISAIRKNRIYEIPGENILQPGFRLVHGYEQMKKIITAVD